MALVRGGQVDGVRILSSENVKKMNERYLEVATSPAPVKGLGFGLGWFHKVDDRGRVSLSHGGNGTGTIAIVQIYPAEKLTVTVVANSTYMGPGFALDIAILLGGFDWSTNSYVPDH
jgi:CubicO group peptidase (beta-lactamase class C family)